VSDKPSFMVSFPVAEWDHSPHHCSVQTDSKAHPNGTYGCFSTGTWLQIKAFYSHPIRIDVKIRKHLRSCDRAS